MGAIKSLPGVITPTRLAQARHVKISIRQGDPIPIQVDGEAYMQDAATLTIFHKGRVQMLCRDRALQRLLNSWSTESEAETDLGELFIAPLDAARLSLIEAARTVGVEAPSVAADLDAACVRSEDMADKLLKAGKGRMRRRVKDYLTAVNQLTEVLRSCVDIPSTSPKVERTRSKSPKPGHRRKISCSDLPGGGSALIEKLIVCEQLYTKVSVSVERQLQTSSFTPIKNSHAGTIANYGAARRRLRRHCSSIYRA
eukprot:m.121172 g.121172  ORF g.121172 m.121172 type:complete len:255 (+) comp13374_c0_seq4:135-899(+)